MAEVKCVAVSVFLLAVGCRSPARPTVTLQVPTLDAGNYTLKFDPGAPTGTPNFCFSGGAPASSSAAFPVIVTQNAATWLLRPTADIDRGLVVNLQVAGAAIEGTATGAAVEGAFLVVFGTTGSGAEPVRLNGTVVSANMLAGYTTGKVEFSLGGATGGCTSYQWYLQPR